MHYQKEYEKSRTAVTSAILHEESYKEESTEQKRGRVKSPGQNYKKNEGIFG